MFKIGVVTDEISDDLVEAINVAKSWGLRHIELHKVWGKNICDVDEATLSKIISIVKKSGMTVTNIDSLTLRCSLSSDEEYSQHIKHLLKSIEIAPLFNTNIVRLFSFWKEQNPDWDRIFEKMELPIKIAEREGIILGFENVSSGNIGKSDDLVRLFNHFDSPNLKLIWDPGNAYADGEKTPYPDGYEKIKDKIVHVHVKDSVINDEGKNIWKPIGQGNVDYKGQLKALLRDNYQGVIALETHCVAENGSKIDGTKQSFDGLMSVVNSISYTSFSVS